MWNSGQQQGTWWPNYYNQYQAPQEDGDRSQEWAVKAALWAQQRFLQEQYQQQNQIMPMQSGNPPLPNDDGRPPLPEAPPPDTSPPEPVIGDAPKEEQDHTGHGFIHEERMKQLQEGGDAADMHEEHNRYHQSSLQDTFRNNDPHGPAKGHMIPFGQQPEYRNSPRGGPHEHHSYGNFSPRDSHFHGHQEDMQSNDQHEPFHEHQDNNNHYNDDDHHSSHPPDDQWNHNQYWNHSQQFRQQPLPVPHEGNFHPPRMEFSHPAPQMPMQIMPAYFQPQALPEKGPGMSIPEQIIAAQMPDIGIADMNKRKALPQWLREGLSKMEKEKQKKKEKEKTKDKMMDNLDATDEAEIVKGDKNSEHEATDKLPIKTERDLKRKSPRKSGYSSDDEQEDDESNDDDKEEKSPEEKAAEDMKKIKLWMTEILLNVTNQEIVSVVNEVYSQARKKAPVSAKQLRDSGGLQALRSGLGMEYDSSSGSESDVESDGPDVQSKWMVDFNKGGTDDVKENSDSETDRKVEAKTEVRKASEKHKSTEKDIVEKKRKRERRSIDGKEDRVFVMKSKQSRHGTFVDERKKEIKTPSSHSVLPGSSPRGSQSSGDEKSIEDHTKSSSTEESSDTEETKKKNRKRKKESSSSDSSSEEEYKSKRKRASRKHSRSGERRRNRKANDSDHKDSRDDKRKKKEKSDDSDHKDSRDDKRKKKEKSDDSDHKDSRDDTRKKKENSGDSDHKDSRDDKRKKKEKSRTKSKNRDRSQSIESRKIHSVKKKSIDNDHKDDHKDRSREERGREKDRHKISDSDRNKYKHDNDKEKRLKKHRYHSSDESIDSNDKYRQRSRHKDGKKQRKHRSKSRSPKRHKR